MFFIIKSCQRLGFYQSSVPTFILQTAVLRTSSHVATNTKEKQKQPFDKTTIRHVVAVAQPVTAENGIPASQPVVQNENAIPEKWQETTIEWRKLPQQYMMLSKIRLTSLVVMTSMAGYALAPAPFDLTSFVLCSVGTGLLSSAANAINQYHEVPFDAQMARTRNRILVRGLLTPLHTLGFATICITTGVTTLYCGINPLTAGLGVANLILYTSIYTPLKRISILNTWVGSIVGALPPLMGWAACSGNLELGAWVLAGILYAWQFPHFNALSWNLRPDYSRAGYRMMSVTNPGLCRRTALRYTAVMLPLSCCAPFLDVTNIWFALESIPLNAYFTYLAWKFYKNSDSSSSRQLFRFSLLQLPVLMVLMLVNKKHWFSESEEENKSQVVASPVSSIESRKLGISLVMDPVL